MLRIILRSGKLDRPEDPPEQAIDRPEHRALLRKAGAEGIVLLKNAGGILPLQAAGLQSIAIIGPNARTAQIMGGGSAQLNPHYRISPWDCLVAALGAERLAYA